MPEPGTVLNDRCQGQGGGRGDRWRCRKPLGTPRLPGGGASPRGPSRWREAGSPAMHACTGLYGLYRSVDTVFDVRARMSESRPLRLRPEPVQGTMQHAQMPLRRSQRLGQCDTTRYDRLGYWLRLGSVCGAPTTRPMISSRLCAWPLPVAAWPLLFFSFASRLLSPFCPFCFYPSRLFGRVVVFVVVVVVVVMIIWSLAGPRQASPGHFQAPQIDSIDRHCA